MANLNAPGRNLVIDGKPVTLRFTVNRLMEVEHRYGSIDKAAKEMQKQPLLAARTLLWIGTGKMTATEEEFGDLDIEPGLGKAVQWVGEAFAEAIGASGETAADPTRPTTARTRGRTS